MHRVQQRAQPRDRRARRLELARQEVQHRVEARDRRLVPRHALQARHLVEVGRHHHVEHGGQVGAPGHPPHVPQRLGVVGQQVQQVGVESDVPGGPRGGQRQQQRRDDRDPRKAADPARGALDPQPVDGRAGRCLAGPAIPVPTATAVDQGQHRKRNQRGQQAQQHPGSGDQPQLGEAGEAHQQDGEERRRRGDRRGADGGPGHVVRPAHGGERVRGVRAFQLVLRDRVDPVRHADADQRRDERRGQRVEVAELEPDRAERPGEPDAERDQHQDRVAFPAEHEQRQDRDAQGGQDRRAPAVAADGVHLFHRHRGRSRERDAVARVACHDRRGDLARGADQTPQHREAVVLVDRRDDDEQHLPVVGGQVAVADLGSDSLEQRQR